MDGPRLKNLLTEERELSKAQMLEMAGISAGKLYNLFKQAKISKADRDSLTKSFKLPKNFFEGPVQVAGDHATQTQTFNSVAECEKDLAVAQETIRQLEIRIKEKDTIISNLLKSPRK